MGEHGLRSRLARIIGWVLGRMGLRPAGRTHPGDFHGTPAISYTRKAGRGEVADTGEVVWTWVPFEEDQRRGKDRPVLVIGHDGPWLLALPLTSKDHTNDAVHPTGTRRRWTEIGSGPWDTRGRPSAVRVDRILRIDPAGVRRQGAVLDKAHFKAVATAVRSLG
jgi:hypothetical protein